jgi:hypothetical protein
MALTKRINKSSFLTTSPPLVEEVDPKVLNTTEHGPSLYESSVADRDSLDGEP